MKCDLSVGRFSQPSDSIALYCFVHIAFRFRLSSSLSKIMDNGGIVDENCRLYIGNLDLRMTEASLIKMFSPFGTIIAEDFLWHTRGAKRGDPRGYAFVQFNTNEEAKLAKEKMNGKLVFGRPLVVRLASEKYFPEAADSSCKIANEPSTQSGGQMSRSIKLAAVKNKLKSLEEETHRPKKQKQTEISSRNENISHD